MEDTSLLLKGGRPSPPSSEGVRCAPSHGPQLGCVGRIKGDERRQGALLTLGAEEKQKACRSHTLIHREKKRCETRGFKASWAFCESALQVAMAFVSLPAPARQRCQSWRCPRVRGGGETGQGRSSRRSFPLWGCMMVSFSLGEACRLSNHDPPMRNPSSCLCGGDSPSH